MRDERLLLFSVLQLLHCVALFGPHCQQNGIDVVINRTHIHFKENKMAIDGVGSNTPVTQQLFSGTPSVPDRDSDNDGARVASSGGGRFSSAISQALTQIGLTAPDGSAPNAGATSATQDPKQAQQAFAQALFSALQGQGGVPGQADGPHKGGGGHHHHGGGGASKIESGLQNLIQQLGASADATGSGATPSSSSSPLAALQSSFSDLVAANGGNSSSASLSTFLQDLSQNLQGAPATGNVVSTKV